MCLRVFVCSGVACRWKRKDVEVFICTRGHIHTDTHTNTRTHVSRMLCAFCVHFIAYAHAPKSNRSRTTASASAPALRTYYTYMYSSRALSATILTLLRTGLLFTVLCRIVLYTTLIHLQQTVCTKNTSSTYCRVYCTYTWLNCAHCNSFNEFSLWNSQRKRIINMCTLVFSPVQSCSFSSQKILLLS